jgi:hypothetical protein
MAHQTQRASVGRSPYFLVYRQDGEARCGVAKRRLDATHGILFAEFVRNGDDKRFRHGS